MPFWSTKPKNKSAAVRCAAIIAAAGASSRMLAAGTPVGKLFCELLGTTVIARTVRALYLCPEISEIVIAAREEDILAIGRICEDYPKVSKVVRGSDTRQRSVLAALMELSDGVEYVAIHDGARPLVAPETVASVIKAAAVTGAAIPVVPLKDTVKFCADGFVLSTPNRENLFAVQTPQVFHRSLVTAALISAERSAVTYSDDCAAVESMGVSVGIAPGDYRNIKITTPEDLLIAQALLHE